MKEILNKIKNMPILVTPLFALVVFYATKYGSNPAGENRNLRYVFQILVALIIWAIYLYFYKEHLKFKNCLSKPLNVLLPTLPIFIFEVIVIISACSQGVVWNKEAFLFSLCLGLESGIVEEIQFRGFAISHAMSIKNTKNQGLFILFYSAFIFGIFHFVNLFHGGDFVPTLGQVIMAFGFGLYFGALYLRTGSILPGAIVHGLFDFAVAYRPADEVIRKSVSTGNTTLASELISNVPFVIIFGIMATIMLRKSKWSQILSNFDKGSN